MTHPAQEIGIPNRHVSQTRFDNGMTLNPLLLFGLVKRIEEYILAALSIGPYGYGLLLSILGGALLLRIEHEAAEARVVDRVDDEKQELFIELERGWELIPQLPHALDELKEPIRARVLLPLPVKPLAPRVSCFFRKQKKLGGEERKLRETQTISCPLLFYKYTKPEDGSVIGIGAYLRQSDHLR